MKKLFVFLMVALMALSAVFANGNTEKTSTESEEITLDFWVRFNDDLSGVIADFEALHPGVKINQVQITLLQNTIPLCRQVTCQSWFSSDKDTEFLKSMMLDTLSLLRTICQKMSRAKSLITSGQDIHTVERD